ncbi:hypothetical protein [Botrimarina sp.]|uniref:hypothetical protein n=1 Tax=Botrimarina sp. TaxID=2795802 RepID=UPI0032EECC4F
MRRQRRSTAALLVGGAAAALLSFTPAVSAAPPPHAAPAYHPAQDAPYAGYYNHAHAAPVFRWGWFGAEQYPDTPKWHRAYHGDLMRWRTCGGY